MPFPEQRSLRMHTSLGFLFFRSFCSLSYRVLFRGGGGEKGEGV